MRWRPLLLALGMIVPTLAFHARWAGSSPFGRDIWKVRLDESSSDHWILLDTGRIRVDGHTTSVFLLAHAKRDAPPSRYDAMKVVGDMGGSSIWAYDGTGSDYVDATGTGRGDASDEAAGFCSAPRLVDVDSDGSDDVVFVEHDFVFGRLLRAVRIEP